MTVAGMSEQNDFITTNELLTKLPVSKRTICKWVAEGKIPCIKLSARKTLFHWKSVQDALLRNQRENATSQD